MKRRIQLCEFGLSMGNTYYLPLATGMLRSYAKSIPKLEEEFAFAPILYRIEHPDDIMKKIKEPDIVGFSVSLWNYNLSLEIARRVKRLWPGCQVVLGGPSVPRVIPPNVDQIFRGEGEAQFASYLLGSPVCKKEDLEIYGSPYLDGTFDILLGDGPKFQAIVETNRGCPNHCSYCYWGHGGMDKRYRFFSLYYLEKVATWIGKNKIPYVFCADSNFGIFERDVEIARIFAKTKALYGYPEKFRVCWGKSNKSSILEAATILNDAGLAKAVTLSRQSLSPVVAKNINRQNMKNETFESYAKQYKDLDIPTYSELILGLPGETVYTFVDGVKRSLELTDNLFIYHCTVLPNTQLAEPEYQEKFGIKTVRVPMAETHCEIRPKDGVREYEDIVVATNTMSVEEWVMLTAWSWEIQLVHSLGYEGPMTWGIQEAFRTIARGILKGIPRSRTMPEAGNVYWEPEEWVLLLLNYHRREEFGFDFEKFAKEKILYARKGRKKEKKDLSSGIHRP